MTKITGLQWLKDHVSFDGQECLIWPRYRDWQGRGRLGVNGKQHKAHRLMCELVHGPCPDGQEAAHECGNGHLGCVHPKHLSWKTQSGNARDRLRHGRFMGNKGGSKTRFTAEQIEELRADLAAGQTTLVLAAKFNVARSVITFWKGKFAKDPNLVVPQPRGTYRYPDGRWQARIIINRKTHYLGLYDTEEEAHQAFLQARSQKDAA